MKRRLLALLLVTAMTTLLLFPVAALADNPVVAITVSAALVSIENTQGIWDIGPVALNAVKYFSFDNQRDDDWSQVENTGNCPVDVELRGTDFDGPTYDWTLSATKGDQEFSLYANTPSGGESYTTEIKSAEVYTFLVENLDYEVTNTYDWSMKFSGPSAFNALEDGLPKEASVTLVAFFHE